MNMTSNCDVTNSAHQTQITTIRHWTKPPHENFLRTPLHITFQLYDVLRFDSTAVIYVLINISFPKLNNQIC